MRRYVSIMLFLMGIFLHFPGFAAPGLPGHRHLHEHEDLTAHDGPIDQEHAIEMASEVITKLANMKKIDASWININAKVAEQKSYPSGEEWVITFNNPNLTNKFRQNLYIFLTIEGKYIAANYTGN